MHNTYVIMHVILINPMDRVFGGVTIMYFEMRSILLSVSDKKIIFKNVNINR